MEPIVGRAKFVLERVRVAPRMPLLDGARCLDCGAEIRLERETFMASFKIGRERLALVCDGCLDAESRERVRALRREPAVQR